MSSRGAAIDISWADHKLAKSCASSREGLRRFGAEQWAVLQRRLAVLRAADNLGEVLSTPGRLHPLTGDRAGQWALDLRGPYRLVFEPDGAPPLDSDGRADPMRITAITVLEVTDYHG